MFRIRIGRGFWTSRLGIGLLGAVLLGVVALAGTIVYYYIQYSRMIDARLSGRSLQKNTQIYSGPGRIDEGEAIGRDDLASLLQRAGYRTQSLAGGVGQYKIEGDRIEIHPGTNSYFHGANGLQVQFAGNTVKGIRALPGGNAVSSAEIEPQLLTNLFDSAREKRRAVRYEDLPKVLVDAVLSAEDKRFFEHPGFDPVRILGAAWADLHKSSRLEGASTITMQVARSFFFTTERTWRRKLAETLVALQLEHRFNKKEIFEFYANEIYLGNRGSFSIHGFAEASLAYFGKDIHQLTLGEAAFLSGIIRAPNHYSSADRRPERGTEARDRVLAQMVDNKQVSPSAADASKKTVLHFVSGSVEASAAPYFVDMVKDHLLEKFSETELLSENFRVYTTLDPQLQHAASEALEIGLKNVDTLLAPRYLKWRKENAKAKSNEPIPEVQVAMIALDPKTGEIKALIGGRNYGQSQLNRAIARRQPGSAFKPFVYAAAFDNAVDGVTPVVTPATTVVDEPTTFEFEGQEYTPSNFGERFLGIVTLRDALTNSLNVAAVKVAEMVGYGRVVQVARQIGLGQHIMATPAIALGAYEMTPLDVAAGYTVFANHGLRAEPEFLHSVVRADGSPVERSSPQTRQALDPRVAYLVTSILQDVLNKGSGAGVRARGFTAPAAGKTGTSRDGWFAGFTSNLLCVVWVGFDDNRDLNLTGGSTAGVFWAEFMKRAVALPSYQNVQDFPPPEGIITATIDPETLQLATPACPITRQEVYIAGTAPTEFCERHGGGGSPQIPTAAIGVSKIFGGQQKPQENPSTSPGTQPTAQPVKPPPPTNR
jgi:penicillin-binding protein 1B